MDNIKVVRTKLHGGHTINTAEFWVAKVPVEIVLDKIIYRKVVMFKNRYISNNGKLAKLRKGKLVLLGNSVGHISTGYLITNAYDLLNSKYSSVRVHRMVALAWVDNDDYVKNNLVDHIDGDPLNNEMHNLRWVSNASNSSAGNYSGSLGGIIVIDMNPEDFTIINTHLFESVTLAGKYINTNYTCDDLSCLPKLFICEEGKRDTDMLLFKTDDYLRYGSNEVSNEYMDMRYPIRVSKLTGDSKTFICRTYKEVINKYNLTNNATGLRETRKQLKKQGYGIVNLHTAIKNVYDVKNLYSSKEYRGLTRSVACDILNCSPATILRRLTIPAMHGLPINSWLVKHTKDSEYPVSIPRRKSRNVYVCDNRDTVLEFYSVLKLAKHFDISATGISVYVNSDKLFKGWFITSKCI